MIKVRCFKCSNAFQLTEQHIANALAAEGISRKPAHYTAECPYCRQANKVSLRRRQHRQKGKAKRSPKARGRAFLILRLCDLPHPGCGSGQMPAHSRRPPSRHIEGIDFQRNRASVAVAAEISQQACQQQMPGTGKAMLPN
jgi:hypothetical protein